MNVKNLSTNITNAILLEMLSNKDDNTINTKLENIVKNDTSEFTLKIYTTDTDKNFVDEHKTLWWNFIESAYEHKGGFKSFRNENDFIKKSLTFKIVYYNDTMVALGVYNPYISGEKCVGIASIQGELHKYGVVGVKIIMRDDVVNWEEYYWIEADEDMERICIEVGGYNLPNIYAQVVLPFEIELCEDEYHYVRSLKGINYKKTIFGLPDNATYKKVIKERYDDFQNFIENIENKAIHIDYNKLQETLENYGSLSEIDCSKKIIYAFYHHTYDEDIYAYPKKLIDKLKYHINRIKKLLSKGNFEHKKKNIYISAIEDGEELLHNIQIIKPLSL